MLFYNQKCFHKVCVFGSRIRMNNVNRKSLKLLLGYFLRKRWANRRCLRPSWEDSGQHLPQARTRSPLPQHWGAFTSLYQLVLPLKYPFDFEGGLCPLLTYSRELLPFLLSGLKNILQACFVYLFQPYWVTDFTVYLSIISYFRFFFRKGFYGMLMTCKSFQVIGKLWSIKVWFFKNKNLCKSSKNLWKRLRSRFLRASCSWKTFRVPTLGFRSTSCVSGWKKDFWKLTEALPHTVYWIEIREHFFISFSTTFTVSRLLSHFWTC